MPQGRGHPKKWGTAAEHGTTHQPPLENFFRRGPLPAPVFVNRARCQEAASQDSTELEVVSVNEEASGAAAVRGEQTELSAVLDRAQRSTRCAGVWGIRQNAVQAARQWSVPLEHH